MNTDAQNIIEVDGAQRSLFFLRGHMRSGTNWVCELLNLHPRISCTGEHHFLQLHSSLMGYAESSWLPIEPADAQAVADAGYRTAIREALAVQVRSKPGAHVLGDRTPEKLSCQLPGAPIVHVVRDGRDVLVSYMFHMLRIDTPHEDPRVNSELSVWRARFRDDPTRFESRPEELFFSERMFRDRARVWARRIVDDQAFIEAAESGAVDSRVLSFRYEDLHGDVDTVRSSMYAFLGLDPSEAAAVESSPIAVPGFGGRGEQPASFHRAGRVGDWQTYFTPDVCRWFEDEAGESLRRAGYEQSRDWMQQPAPCDGAQHV